MRARLPWFLAIALVTLLAASSGLAQAAQPRAAAIWTPAAASTPLQFVENVGQLAPEARFQVRGGPATLFLAADALWLTLADQQAAGAQGVNLRVSFPGAAAAPRIEPFDRLNTRMSFFLGNDPRGWNRDVPVWGGVRYRDLYPGIDLELDGAQGRLAMRLVAHDGANPAAVRMQVDGADQLVLAGDALHITTPVGQLALPLPALEGTVVRPSASPTLSQNVVAAPFAPARSPAATPAPTAAADLAYSTLISSNGDDQGDAVAVDSLGAAYIGGFTSSGKFPTVPGSYRVTPPGINATIVKLAAEPNALPSYSIVIGGFGADYASGIAVDASGAAYVVGYTASRDFPTKAGFDNGGRLVDSTNRDAFVAKFTPDGTDLVWSSYLGGSADERGFEIALDNAGAAYVTGRTTSSDFPVSGAGFDTSYNGGFDAYAAKVSPDGKRLEYATYLGGGENDQGNDITVDASGAAYVTGYTLSPFFPVQAGYDTDINGLEDIFVTKLSSSGASIVYSTFIGGKDIERGESIVVDASGAAYVAGNTLSDNFPGTIQKPAGLNDAYALKLSPNGQALVYAKYLGGSEDDYGTGIAVNANGAAYVSGNTLSGDFPASANAYAPSPGGNQDGFVARLSPAGSAIEYATYLGGVQLDSIDGIALDRSGAPFVTGFTQSSNYPTTTGAYNRIYIDGDDAVLSKLALGGEIRYTVSGSVRAGSQGVAGVTISAGAFSTVTQNDGSYRLVNLPAGSYSITALKSGYSFVENPINLQVNSDLTGVDFTVKPEIQTYSIAGQVTVGGSNTPLPGVTITNGAGGSATTGADGRFVFSGLVASSYRLTPSRSGYSFAPTSLPIVLSGNLANQNFKAQPRPTRVESRTFTPLAIVRTSFSKPPATYCDAYEPNDDRYSNPSPITIGQTIRAKICSSEKLTPPNNLREDNYIAQNPAGRSIIITLDLPAKLRKHVYLAVYDNENLTQTICFSSTLTRPSNTLTCPVRQPGAIIIRLYTPARDKTSEDVEEYVLSTRFQ